MILRSALIALVFTLQWLEVLFDQLSRDLLTEHHPLRNGMVEVHAPVNPGRLYFMQQIPRAAEIARGSNGSTT
jgi:hypothetical protein